MFAEAQETAERLYYEKRRVGEVAHNLKDQLNNLIGQLNDLKIEKGNLLDMVQAREDALRTGGVTFENFTKLKELQAQVDALTAKDEEQKTEISKLQLEIHTREQDFEEKEKKLKKGVGEAHLQCLRISSLANDLKTKLARLQEKEIMVRQHTKDCIILCDKHEAEKENWELYFKDFRGECENQASRLKSANSKAAEEIVALRLQLISILQLQADARDKQQREAAADKAQLLAQVQELEALQKSQDDRPKSASTKKPAAKLPTPPQSPSRDLDQAVNVISSTA